jgi:succinate-semialdehyde dehydrogenase / glutarate-semialdehyde dehydrogenase
MNIKCRNPRTGKYDYEFTPPTPAELHAFAQQQRQHQKAWAALPLAARWDVLQRWHAALMKHRAAILSALSVDTGRYLLSTIEVDGVIRALERWCKLAPTLLQEQEQQSVAMPSISFRTQYVPYALVGVISPWNFPLTLSLIDAIPALVAGCSVIIKPSEITPRFSEPLRQSIAAVPELAPVLTIVPGAGETGAALLEEVDALCFTGSVKTGRLVAEACARRFIPAFLELGGKDPVIVTASAKLEQAATTVLRASVAATGQACQSLERVYVDAAVYDEFVRLLVAEAQQARLNYPDIHHGQIGPLIFDRQADIIADQLADAIAKGAQILCGGEIETHGGGKWMRPTVMVNVNHSMKLMTEETFGPVLPVMPYQTIDEAVALANDSAYGLSAAVIAGDLAEAETIARRLDAGAISLNDGALTGLMYEAEKNSFKLSGMGGSRMGPASFLRFMRKKALLFQHGAPMPLAALDEALAQPNLETMN